MESLDGGAPVESHEAPITGKMEKKVILHVAPRVDPEFYQAEVVETIGDLPYAKDEAYKKAAMNWYDGTRCVYDCTYLHSANITKFLIATRNLFEPIRVTGETLWNENSISIPMESDAIALEYLSSYDYDVEKALFRITCDLGSSKDGVYCTRTGELIDKYPSSAVFTETKERVLRTSKGLLGSYEHNESKYSAKLSLPYTSQSSSLQSVVKEEKLVINEATEKGVVVSDQIGTELVGYNRDYSSMAFPRKIESIDSAIFSISLKSPGSAVKTDASNNNNASSNNSTNNNGANGRSRGQEKDKTEIKKRWQSVLKRGQIALTSMHAFTSTLPPVGMSISASKSDNRPNMETVQEILDEAATLPMYINAPGEDFGETVRGCLGELLVKVSEVRDWVANVHDVLHYYSRNMTVIPIIAELKQILNDGERQPLYTPEEQKLKECLSLHDKIGKECRKILILTNYVETKEDGGDVTVVDGDEEMKTSVKSKRGSKDVDPGSKPLIEQVSNVLNNAKRLPFLCKEVPSIDDLYRKSIKLAEEVQMFFERASKCLVRKPPTSSTRAVSEMTKSLRFPIENSKALLEDVRSFPLYIPLQNELADVIAKGDEWSREVRTMAATALDKSGVNLSVTGRPSRTTQSANVAATPQSVASNKPVSLKRVESLISDGEKMPFEFSLELEILKEKKNQAKLWFERVKSKFPKAKAAGSLRYKNGNEGASSEKINFSDMKLIVEEGEVLFDDSLGRSSKELSKVQSVVEEAEVWLSRVREALTDAMNQPIDEGIYNDNDDENDEDDEKEEGEKTVKSEDDNDMDTDDLPMKKPKKKRIGTLEMLQELLAEADEMPVFMEEALVLRSHLSAIEWSKKARAILAMPTAAEPHPKPSRLVEIQKLSKEINKIRQVVPSHIWDDFPIKQLKEEVFCFTIVSKSEKILSTIKRVTEKNNVLKKGILLDKVIGIYNDACSIHVNLDYELRPLKTAISATEEWIQGNEQVLQKLGVPIVSLQLIENFNDTVDAENNRVWNDESMCWEESKKANSRFSDAAVHNTAANYTPVDFTTLEAVIDAAAGIVTEFPELSECRSMATTVSEWLDRLSELLPKKDATVKPKAADIDTNELVKRVDINDLELLLSASDDIKVDLNKEKRDINASMEKAKVWNKSALVSLKGIQTTMKSVLDSYRTLLCKSAVETESSEDILSHLPFACVRGIKNIGDSSDKDEDDEEEDEMEVTNDSVNGENAAEDDESNEVSPLINVEPVELYENNESNKQTRDTEEALYTQLVDIADVIDVLQKDGNDIGINTEASVLLDVYMSSLNWICEVRTILLVNSDTFSTVNKLGDNQSSKDWGDTTKENVRVLIEDALELVNPESNWSNLYDRYYFNSLLEGSSLENLNIDSIQYTYNTGAGEKGATVASSVKQSERVVKNNTAGTKSVSTPKGSNKSEKGKKKNAEDVGKGANKGKSKKKNSKTGNDGSDEMAVADDSDDHADAEFDGGNAMEEDEPNDAVAVVMLSVPDSEMFSKSTGTPSSKVSKANFKSLVVPSIDAYTITTKSFTYIKHLAPLADAFNSLNLELPTVLEEYFDMFTRLLGILLNRLDEVERWSLVTKKVVTRGENASYGASAKDNRASILHLINWANRRYIYGSIRRMLETHINNYNTWVLRVNQMKQRKKEFLLSMNDLKEFIKTGEKLIMNCPEVLMLKNELKKAKNWQTKVKQSQTGESGASTFESNSELISESQNILVDLASQVDSLQAATLVYCFCRQPFHGNMIGCDQCDEWYHLNCIGLSKSQADKAEKYICYRCMISQSAGKVAIACGEIVNKWMNPADIIAVRQSKRQRLNKKISKEEKEVDRLTKLLKELGKQRDNDKQTLRVESKGDIQGNDDISPDVSASTAPEAAMDTADAPAANPPSTDAGGDTEGNITVESSDKPTTELTAAANDALSKVELVSATSAGTDGQTTVPPAPMTTAELLGKARQDLFEANARLSKLTFEEEDFMRQINIEVNKYDPLSSWMMEIKRILWSKGIDDISLGEPVGPHNLFYAEEGIVENDTPALTVTSASAIDENDLTCSSVEIARKKLVQFILSIKGIYNPYFTLLNKFLSKLAIDALNIGVNEHHDVIDILDSFRWMSFCNICLHMLRCPLSTTEYRKLIDITIKLRVSDERVMRFISSSLQKASSWKSKVKKFIKASMTTTTVVAGDITTNMKKVDTLKLTQFVVEGSTIPFVSRLKILLRTTLEKETASAQARGITVGEISAVNGGDIGNDDDESGEKGGGSGGGTREEKNASKKVSKVAVAVCKGLPGLVHLAVDPEYSSDEDASSSSKSSGEVLPAATPKNGLLKPSSISFATEPKSLWPPRIPFDPQPFRKLTVPEHHAFMTLYSRHQTVPHIFSNIARPDQNSNEKNEESRSNRGNTEKNDTAGGEQQRKKSKESKESKESKDLKEKRKREDSDTDPEGAAHTYVYKARHSRSKKK